MFHSSLAILSAPHPQSYDVKPPPEPDRRGTGRGIVLFTEHVALFRSSKKYITRSHHCFDHQTRRSFMTESTRQLFG
ncbi:hypothetical protein Hdeb2414_s0014g00431821 [Helianthus debilis subsp. tardiflorus]